MFGIIPFASILPMIATAKIDSSLVEELLTLVKTMMGLFTEFPLNILLIASLAGVGFGIFGIARRAATGH